MLIVLSLFIVALILAGHAATSARGASGSWIGRAALAAAAGILIDYTLVLCGLGLTQVLAAIGLLATWGLVKAARGWKASGGTAPGRRDAAWAKALATAYILGLYSVVVLSEPIFREDARVIWFFHGRMIWAEGALRAHTGLGHASLGFSHPDYPNLVPAIAAQLAWARGFWNEFLPKASLLVMLVPPVLWTFSFRPLGGLAILAGFSFFSLDGWLSSGLMDPYLGLYLGMALALFGRYVAHRNAIDLLSTVCAFGIISGLKNEGVLVVMSFAAAVLAAGFFTGRRRLIDESRRLLRDRLFLRILLLAAVPTLLWAALARAWGLRSDMTADLGVNASRLIERLLDGSSPGYLFNFLAVRATPLWLLASLFLVALAVHKARGRPVPRGAVVAALTSLAYFCAMYFVYLATPHDLTWHLGTSARRTMFAASVSLLVALCLLFADDPRLASRPACAEERLDL